MRNERRRLRGVGSSLRLGSAPIGGISRDPERLARPMKYVAPVAGSGSPPTGPGIYVHIPFCLAKCTYCDFNSYPSDVGVPGWYVNALAQDMAGEAHRWSRQFASVFFGGGTPSLLRPEQVVGIMMGVRSGFDLAPEAEITLECNPATVDQTSLDAYRAAGVNRLSVGVQSLSEQELRVLGRKHDPDEALAALGMAWQAGFRDVSADVILGIPGQTEASLEATLKTLIDGVTHVSVYMLSIEPGTPLAAAVSRGLVRDPDDDLLADLYQCAVSILTANGLARYEISNFAREDNACRHNLNYWRCGDYVGLGAGAHSHRGGRRYAKVRDPWDYAEVLGAACPGVGCLAGTSGHDEVAVAAWGGGSGNETRRLIDYVEDLSSEQQMLEEIMLGLRTSWGISAGLPGRLAPAGGAALGSAIDGLVRAGLLVKASNTLTLSPKGVLLHDAVSIEIASALPTPPAGAQSS